MSGLPSFEVLGQVLHTEYFPEYVVTAVLSLSIAASGCNTWVKNTQSNWHGENINFAGFS